MKDDTRMTKYAISRFAEQSTASCENYIFCTDSQVDANVQDRLAKAAGQTDSQVGSQVHASYKWP